MARSEALSKLASDLNHAATAIHGLAGAAVDEAATAVETSTRALDVSTGVVVVHPGPTTAMVAATQPRGVYIESAGAPVVAANTARVADRLADRLLADGVALIGGGR